MSDVSEYRSHVITHDAHRAGSRPLAVVHGGERYDVAVIEDSKIVTGEEASSPVRYCFRVRCAGGARFELECTKESGWSVLPIRGPRLVRE